MSDFNPTPERQKQILSLLARQGRLRVSEIVKQFSISEATARLDVEALAPLESVNTFVTDSNSDKKFIQALKKQGIKVIVA